MFDSVFPKSRKPKKGVDTLHTFDKDGKPTNAPIHDPILEGTDDFHLRRASYDHAKATGASKRALKLLE